MNMSKTMFIRALLLFPVPALLALQNWIYLFMYYQFILYDIILQTSRVFQYYPHSASFSRSGCFSCLKMLSMFCLITSYSLTCFFSLP